MKTDNNNFIIIMSGNPFTYRGRHNELKLRLDENQAICIQLGMTLIGLVPDTLGRKLKMTDMEVRDLARMIVKSYDGAQEEAERKAEKSAEIAATKAAEDAVRGLSDDNSTGEYRESVWRKAYAPAFDDEFADCISAKTDTELFKMVKAMRKEERMMYRSMSMKHIRMLADGKGAVSGVLTERQAACVEGMFPDLEFFTLPVNTTVSEFIIGELGKESDCKGDVAM